jgi:hypothetical protein
MSDRTERASHLAGCVLAYVYITSGNRLPEPGKGAGSTAYVGQKPYQTIVLNMGSKRLVVLVTEEQHIEDGRFNLENPLLSVELFDIDFDDLDDLDDLDEPVAVDRESLYRVHAFEDGVWVQKLLNSMRAAIQDDPAYLH